ncbi:MAG: ATP-dependent DNA helicase RecG [Bacteroidales bacterium]|nr:ATP-dependent DNA helicase RecG [Bacteroidales bacterium]MDD3010776.1 ATP-dependent DNA helicase RecG [Bacteroidales bacterium]MDD3961110.1 ATP-dependent DNA helicase RecG [Bacteroidales bacterium]MDY0284925.1 ATP-dependent DNA helicase RecG [Bacteroidales bacterium]HPE85909.1 ATP-dependent DNA helicase RecG [Bacteroidales bacterium]
MVNHILNTPVEFLKGVGPAKAELLRKELNIFTFGDLLTFYPFRYTDRSVITPIAMVNSSMPDVQVMGKITHTEVTGTGRASRLHAWIGDDSGTLELVWFQGLKWIKEIVRPGREFVAYGKPNYFNGAINIAHPELETSETFKSQKKQRLQGVYHSTEKLKNKGLQSRGIAKLQSTLLLTVKEKLSENLTPAIISFFKFISHEKALINIHFPENEKTLQAARARLKFEEFFFLQLQLQQTKYLRNKNIKGHRFQQVGKYFNDFYHRCLPFELTSAQKKVLKEIRHDVGSGKQMNRLLQGDVGSGKTLVALMAMLLAIDNGYQAAIMAPTEILAEQHRKTIASFTAQLGINTLLLTGSTKAAKRKNIHTDLQSGKTDIIIGTHALIEQNVQFYNLGLVVIDEQHRFGVEQRARLWHKNIIPPHILVMTATPIPRTLAMSLYGDLDYSVIDELPPGRKPVKTHHFYDHDHIKINGFLREQIAKGRQVYIVYPLIEESKKSDLKDLMDGFETISREFPLPQYQVSIVHGRMPAKNKAYEMERFVTGKTHILVATTVIEVGVDVPNATVMLIENAERFGLSQLHQLRGRVGRGAEQSHCILISKTEISREAKIRLKKMVETNDGFEIAKADLLLRGPGDIQGTRQSGILDLKLASISEDEPILKYAHVVAKKIITDDPELSNPSNQPMAKYLDYLTQHGQQWSKIS